MPDHPSPVVVFDAGAFVAYERRASIVRELVEMAAKKRLVAVTSSGVVAQVYRGNPRQAELNRLLKAGTVRESPIDGPESRSVGASLTGVEKPDVVDAHVALLTMRHEATVLTSDRGDIERLGVPADRIIDC